MDANSATDLLVHRSRIQVPYSWSAGVIGSRFLKAIAEERKILATRCGRCGKRFVPPRARCGACFKACEDWVEVGPQATLVSYTQELYSNPNVPKYRPIFGLIRFDGADTAIVHRLGETSLPKLRLGMRVEPVFADNVQSEPLGIRYFRVMVENG